MLEPGKALAVFSIRPSKNGSIWVRSGWAEVNRDGSVNMHLDVLPIDGKLHVREVPVSVEARRRSSLDPGPGQPH